MIVRALRRLLRPLKTLIHIGNAGALYVRRYGLIRLLIKAVGRVTGSAGAPKLRRIYSVISYSRWIKQNEKGLAPVGHLSQPPLISLVAPCYETPLLFLKQLVDSVRQQTYINWQLCLSLSGNFPPASADYLSKVCAKDSRIKLVRLPENLGISGNTNEALEHCDGDYIGFIDHDDTLAPFALQEVARAVENEPLADLIYSDEDKLTKDGGQRHTPHFKPDWSPDLLRSYNYITHLLVIKKTLLSVVGPLRSRFDSAQDYDLALRASEKAKRIVHIPKILYHWREHSGSTSTNTSAKPQAAERAVEVVQEHLNRIGREGATSAGPFFGAVRSQYELLNKPLVSIIIPNKDHAFDLKKCINSIGEKTTYPNYEIIVMENGSNNPETFRFYERIRSPRVRIITWDKDFNYSQINNDGAVEAQGEILLFLNNDVAVITPDWIEQMLMHLQFPEVGAVGAKLLYEDGSIQHAGVIVGVGGIAGHSHKNFPRDDAGYFGRLKVVQNLSAVTAGCLMIKKSVFESVGGFEVNLPIAFNDIDLCLKVRQAGHLIVWTPEAELFHYESKTRGYEDTDEKQKRFLSEIDYFSKKWSDTLKAGDPYYSPNLTLAAEDFSINA